MRSEKLKVLNRGWQERLNQYADAEEFEQFERLCGDMGSVAESYVAQSIYEQWYRELAFMLGWLPPAGTD